MFQNLRKMAAQMFVFKICDLDMRFVQVHEMRSRINMLFWVFGSKAEVAKPFFLVDQVRLIPGRNVAFADYQNECPS